MGKTLLSLFKNLNKVISVPVLILKHRFRPFNEIVTYHGCFSLFIAAISASTFPRKVSSSTTLTVLTE